MRAMIVAAIAMAVAGYIFFLKADRGRGNMSLPISYSKPVPTSPDGVRLIEKSIFLAEYGIKGRSIKDDLMAVRSLITNSQSLIKDFDSYFLPDNQALVAFLQGGNRDRLAWIPSNHPFVSDEGELMDRLGNPLFFHREGGFRIAIRSAGLDERLWTDDDVVIGESQKAIAAPGS